MAKRYRYAFAKKKEAQKGKLYTGLAIASRILQCFYPYMGLQWDC